MTETTLNAKEIASQISYPLYKRDGSDKNDNTRWCIKKKELERVSRMKSKQPPSKRRVTIFEISQETVRKGGAMIKVSEMDQDNVLNDVSIEELDQMFVLMNEGTPFNFSLVSVKSDEKGNQIFMDTDMFKTFKGFEWDSKIHSKDWILLNVDAQDKIDVTVGDVVKHYSGFKETSSFTFDDDDENNIETNFGLVFTRIFPGKEVSITMAVDLESIGFVDTGLQRGNEVESWIIVLDKMTGYYNETKSSVFFSTIVNPVYYLYDNEKRDNLITISKDDENGVTFYEEIP